MKTGLLLQTPPRAQWLQLLSLPGNSRGLACLEVPDVQLFLSLQEGVALLEDPCISSGPEARLLPGLSADSLALGRMSPPTGTCVFGLFANMKKRQVQSSQRVPQLLSQGDNQVFLWHRTVAGRSSNEERHGLPPLHHPGNNGKTPQGHIKVSYIPETSAPKPWQEGSRSKATDTHTNTPRVRMGVEQTKVLKK